MKDYIPTVVFDFDGVIHSYKSGWQGQEVVPDPAVPGIKEAISELRDEGYRVVVVSTRCSTDGGIRAVRAYLAENGIVVDDVCKEKPPAICYIDDRAIRFTGRTETLVQQVMGFHSWVEMAPPCPTEGLRPCRAAYYDRGTMVEVFGLFHHWGINFMEFEAGPGNYTTALVEAENGKVYECAAGSVQFLDRGSRDEGGVPDGLTR